MTIPLKGKVVLITGASSGFGEDAARLFAAEGARVVITARRLERLQAQAALMQAAPGEVLVLPMDVTVRADIESAVKTVIQKYGRIDILFNNAGFGRFTWFDNLEPCDVQTLIDVNLTGLILVTQIVLPYMLAQKSGHIINMSSVAGWIGAPLYSVYGATKFGVRGFTDSLRREVGLQGVKVSGIYPGPAATELGHRTGLPASSIVEQKKFKPPRWTYMTSTYVARRVVDLAKHPRRALIIPWWFRPIQWVESNFPAGVDWVLDQFFVKKFRNI
jgi:NADP-dependent 3-hydroxy acid dehydrogenase YdfG